MNDESGIGGSSYPAGPPCDCPRGRTCVDHRRGQLPGERVLLARVKLPTSDRPPSCPVSSRRARIAARRRHRLALEPAQPQRGRPGERAEAERSCARRDRSASSRAGVRRGSASRRSVVGPFGARGAADRRRDPGAGQSQPVVGVVAARAAAPNPARCSAANRKSPERSPVKTRPTSGSRRCAARREAEDHQRRPAGRRSPGSAGPSRLARRRTPQRRSRADLLAPVDEPRAAPAGDDLALELASVLTRRS